MFDVINDQYRGQGHVRLSLHVTAVEFIPLEAEIVTGLFGRQCHVLREGIKESCDLSRFT